jgi:ABC-2 type transport system ATP-binding protein
VRDAAAAERARAALARCGRAERTGEITVALTVDHGARALPAVVRTLDAEGIEVESLAVREPSLDDVFLTLTGHATSEDDAA